MSVAPDAKSASAVPATRCCGAVVLDGGLVSVAVVGRARDGAADGCTSGRHSRWSRCCQRAAGGWCQSRSRMGTPVLAMVAGAKRRNPRENEHIWGPAPDIIEDAVTPFSGASSFESEKIRRKVPCLLDLRRVTHRKTCNPDLSSMQSFVMHTANRALLGPALGNTFYLLRIWPGCLAKGTRQPWHQRESRPPKALPSAPRHPWLF